MPTSGEFATLRAALRGQYAIERELGRGGMGVVYLAEDERLERPVALKVLPPALATRSETRERFLREARLSAQLSHPNIVDVYRADELEGFAFFAMQYVEGENLAERIRARERLGPDEVVRVLRETAWALAYAHARGVVHRDVKAENILMERATGRAIVTDFGIARSDVDPSLTADGYVLGTVHYMSPEQCAGDALDGRSDLYSLGVVGYHALAGRLPFESDSPQAVIVAHATKAPPPLREIAPEVPAPLAAVIDRCLRKDPAERYATGEELAEALVEALEASDTERRSRENKVLSTDEAAAVWRRAAQLQAEAAQRLESRVRGRGISAETRALRARGADGEANDAVDGTGRDVLPAGAEADATAGTPEEVSTDGYRAHDVEAAAVEAGISQRYVALAMAELERAPTALHKTTDVSPWRDQLATRVLGTSTRVISTTRAFRTDARHVLQALGRTLQGSPWGLELEDTIGGHPLDGGVMLFKVPDMGSTMDYRWTWVRYGVYVRELRCTIQPLAGDPRGCEVTMQVDLRPGLTPNLFGYGLGMTGGLSAAGAGLGAGIGKAALALGGVALGMAAVGGAALLGVGALLCTGPLYRWEIRKATAELDAALAAVDGGLRSLDLFGEIPRRPAPARDPFGMMVDGTY